MASNRVTPRVQARVESHLLRKKFSQVQMLRLSMVLVYKSRKARILRSFEVVIYKEVCLITDFSPRFFLSRRLLKFSSNLSLLSLFVIYASICGYHNSNSPLSHLHT